MADPVKDPLITNTFSHETVFDLIWRTATASNINLSKDTQTSIRWLANKASHMHRLTDYDLKADAYAPRAMIGQMFLFHYFPKLYRTLPYYDIFPLVMPLNFYKDGMLALNLHYISPYARYRLLRELERIGSMGDSRRRLELSYAVLKSAADTEMYLPCIKRYLYRHYRSHFIKIEREDWKIALFLPLARFQKHEPQYVWRKSSNQVRNLVHGI